MSAQNEKAWQFSGTFMQCIGQLYKQLKASYPALSHEEIAAKAVELSSFGCELALLAQVEFPNLLKTLEKGVARQEVIEELKVLAEAQCADSAR